MLFAESAVSWKSCSFACPAATKKTCYSWKCGSSILTMAHLHFPFNINDCTPCFPQFENSTLNFIFHTYNWPRPDVPSNMPRNLKVYVGLLTPFLAHWWSKSASPSCRGRAAAPPPRPEAPTGHRPTLGGAAPGAAGAAAAAERRATADVAWKSSWKCMKLVRRKELFQ